MTFKKFSITSVLVITIITCCSPKKSHSNPELESKNGDLIVKKTYTTIHIFTAKLIDIEYHNCLGRTSMCPVECGNSGEKAKFEVITYKTHLINGDAGKEKLTNYTIQLSDYFRKDFDKDYVKYIRTLKKGDVVTIHTEYVYDTTKNMIATIEEIKSISK